MATGKRSQGGQSSGRFVVEFMVILLLLCGGVSGLNIAVNPYGIYPTRWLEPVIWSDRREKLELLRDSPVSPELLVFGSSRMMRVAPAEIGLLTGMKGFNLAVNHARTEDFLALLRYAVLKLGLHPRVVVVGLDLHAFRGFYESDNLLKYYPELAYYIDNERANPWLYSWRVGWLKFTKSLSFPQLELSVQALHRLATAGPWSGSYRFSPDGTLVYNDQEDGLQARAAAADRLENSLTEAAKRYRLEFQSFGGISETRKQYFLELTSFCRKHGIELVAIMLPYHPRLLEQTRGSAFDQLNRQWEQDLIELARQEGIVLIDAQDLAVFRGDPDGFYDEIHMLPENSDRMIRYVIARAGLEARGAL